MPVDYISVGSPAIEADRAFNVPTRGRGRPGEVFSQVAWYVPFEDVWRFLSAMLGEPLPPATTWATPEAHPENPNLFAQDFDFTSGGANADADNPDHAIVTITYGTPPFNYEDEVWLTRQRSTGLSMLTTQAGTLKFADDTVLNQDGAYPIPTEKIRVTRHQVTDSQLATFRTLDQSLRGRCNNATIDGYPTGTLLYSGGTDDQSFSRLGNRVTSFTFEVSYRWIPWNYARHPGTGVPELVTFEDGSYQFPLASFSGLYT